MASTSSIPAPGRGGLRRDALGLPAMSRRVTSAGGMYAFISHGLGRTVGLGAAAVVTVAYAVLTAAIIGAFGYFAAYLLLANRGALAAADGVPFVQAIPWTVPAVFAGGAGAAVWLRARGIASSQPLGRVVLDEA